MTVPGIVQSTLGGDEIAARASLGGEDELFITPSSTLIYRAEGLLSDESVEEYPHGADRLTLSEGRRKTRFTLEYSLEGEREFTIPASATEEVLHPVLAGVLNGNGITDAGETVVKTYRFSELTLIVTSNRLVKHIGSAVWDDEFEQYHFDDVTSLSFEDGSVATQIVMVVDGRPERIKAPNSEADEVCERLKRALFAYYDVDSLEALNERVAVEDEVDESPSDPTVAFGDGVEPLDANPPEPEGYEPADDHSSDSLLTEHVSDDDPLGDDRSAVEPAAAAQTRGGSVEAVQDGPEHADEHEHLRDNGNDATQAATNPELMARIDALEEQLADQTDLIEHQQATLEQLIDELRQGR